MPAGEMPFLDHLEELRSRILRSLGAVIVGFVLGFWLVQHFQLVTLLKEPIAPYLLGGKLTVLSPTEPVKIVFELAFVLGLVLTSPFILWQVWAFTAPALYEREKRALVPALFIGLALFLTGGTLGYLYVVPQALRVLFSFQSEAIAPMVTYDAYFDFILQIVLALGISFELPLVIVILAGLGVVTPVMLHRFRRFAVVGACVMGAVLSPGTDLLSMIMMTVPLLVLYEVGVLGAVVVHRRRLRRAAAEGALVLIALFAGAGRLGAQQPVRAPGDTTRAAPTDTVRARAPADSAAPPGARGGVDTARAQPPGAADSAQAARLGLPTAPSRQFAPADSALDALLGRPGYEPTRFLADSATVFAEERRIELQGAARTDRQGITLEADSIGYREQACEVRASGTTHLFDEKDKKVVAGEGITYDTCERRGVIRGALTTFDEGSTVWFLRGNVAKDSTADRIYAASSEITSCDLPSPHYHFAAGKVKWVSKTVLVARPIVLYVRDVPILWLPFIFQDTRPGRRSGILIPQFGINDIFRTSRSYERQISNIGYYFALSDYLDLTTRLDWYARRYVQLGVSTNYNVLNRFMSGSAAISRQWVDGGGSVLGLQWSHQQKFNLATSLNFNLNYASNTSIVRQNAIDPRLTTREIRSQLNFTRNLGWAQLNLGGSRVQSLSDARTETVLPSLTLTPRPLDFGRNVTWTPNFAVTNTVRRTPADSFVVFGPDGLPDTVRNVGQNRATALSFDTPLRIGGFTWRNSVSVQDQQQTGGVATGLTERVPDLTTPDPFDSLTVTRTGDFSTAVDWQTGINLPLLFRSTWKLQPAVNVTNKVGGTFALRNRLTGGDYLVQGKKLELALQATPTFFGFFGGIGPVSRIRHSISPQIQFRYSPSTSVSDAFARAASLTTTQVDAVQQLSVGLQQTFEAKGRPPKGDTLGLQSPAIRKYRLLSISTSPITYDFERAKKPGLSGWITQSITNTFLSDLLPSFNLALTHDLWRGVAGTDTAVFHPFLSAVSANFSLSSNTFRSLGSLIGLGGHGPPERGGAGQAGAAPGRPPFMPDPNGRGNPGGFFNTMQPSMSPFGGGPGLNATVRYTLNRVRPVAGVVTPPSRQSVDLGIGFRPTPFWDVNWQTQYNITDKKFEANQLSLTRDLHEWRAAFSFVRAPNGNVAFNFSIYLTDLPQLKFDLDQTNVGTGGFGQ
ncbi:MAG TPA: twin-arginine translocase subunit TatC [Gemmatimonadales bacterium]|nr:twin-arginine translocase subunit TatC [Gemmatimonadales bacterium]